MTGRRVPAWVAAAAVLAPAALFAHDFWIEPSTFRPAAGEEFDVEGEVVIH